MTLQLREACSGTAIEMAGDHKITTEELIFEHRFAYTFDIASGAFKSGFEQYGSGSNHVLTRNIKSDQTGYINAVTRFGPKVVGASAFATSAKAASVNSAIVMGSIDDKPILPMAFVSKFPSKPCLCACGDDAVHSPLLKEASGEPNAVTIDASVRPAIEQLIRELKAEILPAAYSANSLGLTPQLWKKCYWCLIGCELGAKACIVGTEGIGLLLCLAAQAACEAACLESHGIL